MPRTDTRPFVPPLNLHVMPTLRACLGNPLAAVGESHKSFGLVLLAVGQVEVEHPLNCHPAAEAGLLMDAADVLADDSQKNSIHA